jgi:hypothetical protein
VEKAVSKTSESGMDYAASPKSRQSDGRKRWNNRANVRILCVKIKFKKLFLKSILGCLLFQAQTLVI